MSEKEDLGAHFKTTSDFMIASTFLFRKRAYTFPSIFSGNDSLNDSLEFSGDNIEDHEYDRSTPDKVTPDSPSNRKTKSLTSKSSSCLTPVRTLATDPATIYGTHWGAGQWNTPLQNTSMLGLPSPISQLISPLSVYNTPHLPIRYVNYSPVYGSPVYGNPYYSSSYAQTDRVTDLAKQHRNAAAYAEARHTWSGILISSVSHKNPSYSCKVFLGGVPWEMTDHDIKLTFSRFGNPTILRPGHHVKLSRGSQSKERAGYLYLIFESDKQVKALINACTHDFSNGGKYYFALNQSRFRPKDVQIIPWNVNDTSYVKSPSARMETNKTVFVGALHGMLTAEGLAQILEDLFGGVVYVGIDTDKYKYPIGSGRVTFSTTKAYSKAVQAAFIDIKSNKFTKKVNSLLASRPDCPLTSPLIIH